MKTLEHFFQLGQEYDDMSASIPNLNSAFAQPLRKGRLAELVQTELRMVLQSKSLPPCFRITRDGMLKKFTDQPNQEIIQKSRESSGTGYSVQTCLRAQKALIL
ncbi:MAG: hypothetical protein QXT39_02565 [Conexivisphaerales archaeon]